MIQKKKKGKTSYGIIGLGRFGFALAKELAEAGEEILVLDRNEDHVREARELTENALVINNAVDKNSLIESGIQGCDVAVVCISEQIDASILITLNLVSLGIPTVIAKASSAEHGVILEKLGAQVVYPERDMAIRLAHRLESTGNLDFVQLSERVNISKQIVPEKMLGKTIMEVNLRGKFGLNIVAIENERGVCEDFKPDYAFEAGDIIFVVGDTARINRFEDWANK